MSRREISFAFLGPFGSEKSSAKTRGLHKTTCILNSPMVAEIPRLTINPILSNREILNEGCR